VSRLTKNIRLVLISSSLVLPGCGRHERIYAPRRVGGPNPNMPTACGPVDGRTTGQQGYVERVEDDGCYAEGNSSQPGSYSGPVRGYRGPVGSSGIPVRGYGVPVGGYVSHTRTNGGSSWGHSSTFGGGHSSIGGSVRGGFGSTAHGVSS
jgi:hypothetical protein